MQPTFTFDVKTYNGEYTYDAFWIDNDQYSQSYI